VGVTKLYIRYTRHCVGLLDLWSRLHTEACTWRPWSIQPSFFSSWQTYKLEVAPKWWGNTKDTGKNPRW